MLLTCHSLAAKSKTDAICCLVVTHLGQTAGVQHLVVAVLGELSTKDDVIPDGPWAHPGRGRYEA